jgi:UDP-N-acetylglucosamine 2-epimerase (non-hydrolysing)/GDP/UDP-N,N'-diacetylbacillosamine 2-epimerase (hydrolysing)
MSKICFITGSRADYGLLSRLMKLIQEDITSILQIIVTNMHVSTEFGLTYKEIEEDGFRIDKKVEMLLASDTANATAKSVGLATIGFADAYEDLKPEIIIVLGDRFEILAAVTAALFFKIPVAHIHGGEITEGAYDDAIRHAITKMSHIHFTSTEEYRNRVIQLGEEPERVFNVGALGIDNIKYTNLINKKELQEILNFQFGQKCILVTFHPVTLEDDKPQIQMQNLLFVLDEMEDLRIIFTMPNSDTNGRIIINLINKFVEKNKNRSVAFTSLGKIRYLSTLRNVNAIVGNSSSGIIEAPSFGIPTLNLGNRQKGRLRSKTIIDCDPVSDDIHRKLKFVLSQDFADACKKCHNPYEKDGTAAEIYSVIKSFKLDKVINKSFYNL